MNLPDFDPEEDITLLTSEELYRAVESIVEEAMILNGVYYDIDDLQRETDSLTPEIIKIVTLPRFSHIQYNATEFTELVTYLTVKLG